MGLTGGLKVKYMTYHDEYWWVMYRIVELLYYTPETKLTWSVNNTGNLKNSKVYEDKMIKYIWICLELLYIKMEKTVGEIDSKWNKYFVISILKKWTVSLLPLSWGKSLWLDSVWWKWCLGILSLDNKKPCSSHLRLLGHLSWSCQTSCKMSNYTDTSWM